MSIINQCVASAGSGRHHPLLYSNSNSNSCGIMMPAQLQLFSASPQHNLSVLSVPPAADGNAIALLKTRSTTSSSVSQVGCQEKGILTMQLDQIERECKKISTTNHQLGDEEAQSSRPLALSFLPPFLVTHHDYQERFMISPSKEDDHNFGGMSNISDIALTVAVSSAVELDEKQINLITRKMQKLTGFRKVRLATTIDPSLIAGFVIRYGIDGSDIIDLSVKGQLSTLAARVESSDRRTAAACP